MPISGQRTVRGEKSAPESGVRTAEQPGQAINIDLCFVPEQHTGQEKLPAVSGSSGRLIVERPKPEGETPDYPGQVFAEADLEYSEAMQAYIAATRDRLEQRSTPPQATHPAETETWRVAWAERMERHQVREERKREDAAWQAAKAKQRKAVQAFQALSKTERKEQSAAWQTNQAAWRQLRQKRQASLKTRKQEDEAWHQHNRVRQAAEEAPVEKRTWIAILVIIDNCTRQCLGLPLFVSGSRLTSDEVVRALRALLPEELAFLISDQGTHFRSKAFAHLAEEEEFIHVPVYRHRPQSNGIAERFVSTLKDWLRSQSWVTHEELGVLLSEFQPEYNDRPHQGLPFPGLSPKEYANQIWLM